MHLLCFLPLTLLAAAATPEPHADDTAALARSSNAFAFDLYHRLSSTPGNQVASPASVTTALAMTWGGAKGETAAQMRRVLHLVGSPASVMRASGGLIAALTDPKRPVVFRIANRLFGEKTYAFEPSFLESTRAAYGAALEPLDFRGDPEAARGTINSWVESETEKRIPDLVPPKSVDSETRLALVNAIYFLGDWDEPFEKESTRPAPFFASAKEQKDVPTMHRTASLRMARRPGLRLLELPYKGQDLSLLVVLPEAQDGLGAVEGSLTALGLEDLVRTLIPVRVAVALPRFEINPAASLALADVLRRLGMPTAFDRERADFTGIANPPDPQDRLFIGQVFHKAFVKVDEKGTEAAAATAVIVMRTTSVAAPAQSLEFKADHPFLFFIRDRTSGLLLFMGRVADPSIK